jgi:hypothetical protein
VIRFFVPYAARLKLRGRVGGERADVTDFFSFLVTLVDEMRGQA